MVTVILAEKPSQAKNYVEACQASKKCDGYFQVKDSMFHDEETYITYCFGHLIELASPEKHNEKWATWNLDNLPIFPDNYNFEVSKETISQFKKVKSLLKKADRIVIATDCDREGENIAWSVIRLSGASKDKEFKRLWINSLEKEAVREGFKNLKNASDFYSYFIEAQTRQISDWLIGMNASPLYSLNFKNQGIDDTFSIGRVQTPTLYMIYNRQREIESFKKEKYYQLEVEFDSNETNFKAQLKDNVKFKSQGEIKSFLADKDSILGKNIFEVVNVEENLKHTSSPKLHSLNSLQSKMNSLMGATANSTLEATESLYLKKFLSYPRSDTHYITNAEFDYLSQNIKSYADFLNVKIENPNSQPRKRYVDSSKVGSHYAIILTKTIPSKTEFEKMPELEKAVYLEIAKTTLAMFFPDYEYQETVIDFDLNGLLFTSKGQVPKILGWKALFKKSDSETETLLPDLEINQTLEGLLNSVEKETKPPKLFTEGSLITAMKTASKTLDDEEAKEILAEVEGIGTVATRGEIIETLKKKNYIMIVKNRVIVTEKGKILCQVVEKQPLLSSVEMTAKWEAYLKKIGEKSDNATQEVFLSNVKKFISHLISCVADDMKATDLSKYKEHLATEIEKSSVGCCPKCKKGKLLDKKKFIGCSNYPDCDFIFPSKLRGKKMTGKNIKELLEGKETIVKRIKKKDSKATYDATVKVIDGKIEFVSFAISKAKHK